MDTPQSLFSRNYGTNGGCANMDIAKSQMGFTYAIGDNASMRVLPAVAQIQ